jgi:DNA-binding CsgD family transcriptional regulator
MSTNVKHSRPGDDVAPLTFVQQLRAANGFVEVGIVICEAARARELDCSIALLSAHGSPLLTVEYGGGEKRFCHSVPITALTERIGVIRWTAAEPLSDRCEELAAIGAHVSVRMAQLGHVSCLDQLAGLTTRQAEVASMAARGCTNIEIAEYLGVSANTIKKHLGEVFARLHLANRTELALRFSRLATVDLVPRGVSLMGDYRVIRGFSD